MTDDPQITPEPPEAAAPETPPAGSTPPPEAETPSAVSGTPSASAPADVATTDDAAPTPDYGTGEVATEIADAQAQGYIGLKADPLPNSAHSQESGPDGPPVHEAAAPDIADLGGEA